MILQSTDTILARSTESRKYALTDIAVSISASGANEVIVIGGHNKEGKGLIHCLGPDGEMKWSQTYPTGITCVSVSARATIVVFGGDGKAVQAFSPYGQMIWTEDCRAIVRALALSASGKFVVVGLADGNINVFDNDIQAARKFVWKHKFDKPVTDVEINGDGTLVCASTEGGELTVFTERGDLVWSKEFEGGIDTFRIAAEGDAVLVASGNKLTCYSAEVGKSLWTVQGGGQFTDVDMTRKGERFVGICKDGFIYCYDKSGVIQWKYFLGNPGETGRVSLDGKTIVASSIDAVVHCVDHMGNLLWKHATGGSGLLGLTVTENGDSVVASTSVGILYFENIQVVGGLLPQARHEMSLAKERGASTFKAEKLYEEAMVALNYGDYITAAAKVREMEKALGPVQKPVPSPEAVVTPEPAAPLAAKPVTEPPGTSQNARSKIDAILAETEEIKKRGADVEPVENLLGEAMVLLEDGKLDDALAYVQDATEMLNEIKANLPPPAPVERIPPVAPTKPKEGKDEALKMVEKAAKMMDGLKGTELSLEAAGSEILNARALIQTADYDRAKGSAKRAIVMIEKALEPYITECLVDVQKLLKTAEKEGIKTEEPKKNLGKVRDLMKATDYLGALDTIEEVEDWLEAALKQKREAPPPVAPKPTKFTSLEQLKAEMATKPKKPEEPAAKPVPSVPKAPAGASGKEEPQKVLGDAEAAVKANNVPQAVEMYMRLAEAAVDKARTVTEDALTRARERMASVQKEGFDISESEGLVEAATKELNVGNYTAAVANAMQAYEKADTAASAEILNVIQESRKALDMAHKIGADIRTAEELINNAEAAMKKREYKVAIDFADKGVAEVEKTSNETVSRIISDGKALVEKAKAIGADTKEVNALLDEATKALQDRVFMKAHDLAKKAAEAAKDVPKKFVTDKFNEARNKVVSVEKLGADTMMAKNHLIKARSALAGNDLGGAMKAVNMCLEETAKAPKALVNKRLVAAKADMEEAKAMGQSTEDVEALLGQVDGAISDGKFDEALKVVEQSLSKLKEIKELGMQATNAMFDADMAISVARDSGKDVTKAGELWQQAIDVRAKDPGKARELALEIKKMLEG